MTFFRCRLVFRVFLAPQHPVPILKSWGLLPSWTWSLLQSASGPLDWPSPIRLSWDSFTQCPSADFTVSRPLPVDFRTSRAETQNIPYETNLRQNTATHSARSALVGSHHLNGLLRVTALGVLQPKPAGVRCVSVTSDLHHLASQSPKARVMCHPRSAGTLRRTFITDSRKHLTMPRFPLEVAAQLVLTRRSFPTVWPSAGRYSAVDSGLTSPTVAGLRCGPRPPMGFYFCAASETEVSSTRSL